MERFTKKDQLAGHGVHYVSEDDCFDVWSVPKRFMGAAIDRLAAYEDTGLEPEEIKDLIYRFEKCRAIRAVLCDPTGQPITDPSHMRDLLQAEKAGRLVVLPCKIGDTVWVLLEDGGPCMARVQGISMSATCEDILLRFGGYPPVSVWGSDIGKTWFLTREEAENGRVH